jgi:hypothetical protein
MPELTILSEQKDLLQEVGDLPQQNLLSQPRKSYTHNTGHYLDHSIHHLEDEESQGFDTFEFNNTPV